MSTKDWIKFIAIGLIWGSTFMWVKLALREIGPFTLVMLRAFFATVALAILIKARKLGKIPVAYLGIFFIIGLLNAALPFALVAWSEKYISSGMASILNSTVPLFTMVISPFFVKEDRFTWIRILGLLIGFGGVILLMSNKVTEDLGTVRLGQFTMLLAAVSYALAAVYARKKAVGLSPEWQSLLQMGWAFLMLSSLTLVVENPVTLPQLPITWISALWMGVIGSCIGQMLFFDLLYSIGPTRTTLVSYIFPLVGVLLGTIFLGEKPGWHLIVGGLLIVSGVFLVNRTKREVQNE